MDQTLIFGPVPSRRLGKSVGINNIPPKICTYSCVYCQLGKSLEIAVDRRNFYDPKMLVTKTREKLETARTNNEPIDYLTIVSEGEPTLDKGLGDLLRGLGELEIKTAVITNSTLLDRPEVRGDLSLADWVSVKVDTLDEKIWRKINRPHKKIAFHAMLEGICTFSNAYKGQLVTETMLLGNLNDKEDDLEKTSAFITRVRPSISYLSIPTRPPAVKGVHPPEESKINRAFQIFSGLGLNTEYLIGYEGNQFAYTGNEEADILSITTVHPMREDAVLAYLKKADKDFSIIDGLVGENRLLVSEYNGERFYLRTLTNR